MFELMCDNMICECLIIKEIEGCCEIRVMKDLDDLLYNY